MVDEQQYAKNWFKALELKKEVERWLIRQYINITNFIHTNQNIRMFGSNNHAYTKEIFDNTAIKYIDNKYVIEYSCFMIYPTDSIDVETLYKLHNLNRPNTMFIGLGMKNNEFNSDNKEKELVFYFQEVL